MNECVRFLNEEERVGYDFVAEYLKREKMRETAQPYQEEGIICKRLDDSFHAPQ